MSTKEPSACPSCNTVLEPESDFCPHCGELLIDGDKARCKNHETKKGVAVCIICAEPVCEACMKKVDNRTFCTDHLNVRVEQDWALIYESSDINDAELAKSVLVEAGFQVIDRNFSPIGYVWDGAGDSPFSRSALKKQAKVFVHVQEYDAAAEVLDEWAQGG